MAWILLFIPVFGGLISFFIAPDKIRRGVLLLTGLAHLSAALITWGIGLSPVTGWIGMDPLGLIFLLITALLFIVAASYTVGYLARHETPEEMNRRFSREAVFTGTMLMFLGTITLAIVSQHTGIFWMAIEATTLASATLISYRRSARSLEAAWKYLMICSVGIAMALIGNIALAVSASFDPSLHDMPMTFGNLASHANLLQSMWLKGAFVFLLIGYGTKMGLAPMHTWLPDAHSEAPSPVSALLSGVLLNCAFLGILRTNNVLARAGLGDISNTLLVVFGLTSMILAGWFIVQQTDYKRLLAYSSVEHMGILAVATGACTAAHFGTILHALNHSLAKGLLFLCAGNILNTFRTKSAGRVKGIFQVIPFTGLLWIAGFMAISGLPPFGMFVSELSIFSGLGVAGRWYLLAVMLFALGIIFVGMSKIIIPMAYGRPDKNSPMVVSDNRLLFNLPPLILAMALLCLGCFLPEGVTKLIQQATLGM